MIQMCSARHLCAGYVVQNGRITLCAPSLGKRISYRTIIALRIGD